MVKAHEQNKTTRNEAGLGPEHWRTASLEIAHAFAVRRDSGVVEEVYRTEQLRSEDV
jgi:hypothetical protein